MHTTYFINNRYILIMRGLWKIGIKRNQTDNNLKPIKPRFKNFVHENQQKIKLKKQNDIDNSKNIENKHMSFYKHLRNNSWSNSTPNLKNPHFTTQRKTKNQNNQTQNKLRLANIQSQIQIIEDNQTMIQRSLSKQQLTERKLKRNAKYSLGQNISDKSSNYNPLIVYQNEGKQSIDSIRKQIKFEYTQYKKLSKNDHYKTEQDKQKEMLASIREDYLRSIQKIQKQQIVKNNCNLIQKRLQNLKKLLKQVKFYFIKQLQYLKELGQNIQMKILFLRQQYQIKLSNSNKDLLDAKEYIQLLKNTFHDNFNKNCCWSCQKQLKKYIQNTNLNKNNNKIDPKIQKQNQKIKFSSIDNIIAQQQQQNKNNFEIIKQVQAQQFTSQKYMTSLINFRNEKSHITNNQLQQQQFKMALLKIKNIIETDILL